MDHAFEVLRPGRHPGHSETTVSPCSGGRPQIRGTFLPSARRWTPGSLEARRTWPRIPSLAPSYRKQPKPRVLKHMSVCPGACVERESMRTDFRFPNGLPKKGYSPGAGKDARRVPVSQCGDPSCWGPDPGVIYLLFL